MQTNRLLKKENSIIRVFETKEEQAFIIDCIKKTMPKWVDISSIADYVECSETELLDSTDMQLWNYETLDAESRRFIHEHYTWIAGVLPFISDEKQRNKVISKYTQLSLSIFGLSKYDSTCTKTSFYRKAVNQRREKYALGIEQVFL